MVFNLNFTGFEIDYIEFCLIYYYYEGYYWDDITIKNVCICFKAKVTVEEKEHRSCGCCDPGPHTSRSQFSNSSQRTVLAEASQMADRRGI